MNERRPSLIMTLLPLVILYFIQNISAVMMSQLGMAYLAVTRGPIGVFDLIDEVMEMATGVEFGLMMSLLYAAVGILVFGLWYNKIKQEKTESLPAAKSAAPVLFGVMFLSFGCQYLGTFIINILAIYFPGWIIEYQQIIESMGLSINGGAFFALSGLYTVIAAPLVEELAFRGLTLHLSKQSVGDKWAVVASSVLFAAYHNNAVQGIYTFLFAMVLGTVVIKTGRLWISVVIHMVFNAISLVGTRFIYPGDSPGQVFVIMFTSLMVVYLGLNMVTGAYAPVSREDK